MKKNIFIIFIILICMILSVNAESNKDPFYRIKDKIIWDNNFTIETNHRTSWYCRGWKLLLNKKNIFEYCNHYILKF